MVWHVGHEITINQAPCFLFIPSYVIEEGGEYRRVPCLSLSIIWGIDDMLNAGREESLIYLLWKSPYLAVPGRLPGSGALFILIINECV